MTLHNKRMNELSNMFKRNQGMVGRGMCINFKTHNRQRDISEEKEEEKYMKKNNLIRGVSGEGLVRLKPLRFNY
jgi:hypothetical protein